MPLFPPVMMDYCTLRTVAANKTRAVKARFMGFHTRDYIVTELLKEIGLGSGLSLGKIGLGLGLQQCFTL